MNTAPNDNLPNGNALADSTIYTSAAPNAQMNAASIGIAGGSQPHPNIQPYTCVNFIIAIQGIFPSRN